jgi:hypothetical protein
LRPAGWQHAASAWPASAAGKPVTRLCGLGATVIGVATEIFNGQLATPDVAADLSPFRQRGQPG